ncbi:hypothetical protein PRZ48_010996 [Zasmidium cellare]|uniref:Pyrroline-5-carboxylate reductase n=1 Tax=Zasmidium cellare TaxID=395010 RepID=A0ABR0EBB4_ZASCE|nr:hypothetical protein PRZ48_010996 [Zasmidium cellare]
MTGSSDKTLKIAILGCGYMGTALLDGWLQRSKHTFTAHVKSQASHDRLQQSVSTHSDRVTVSHGDDKTAQAAKDADIILLGILPGELSAFLKTPGLVQELKGKVVVSMLAGVPTSQLQQELASQSSGEDWKVARIIPTIGSRIGESVTLVADPEALPEHFKLIDEAFSSIGSVQHVPEAQMDAATAIGAAVHALAIVATDSVTDASVASGVPRATAQALTAACLKSAGALFNQGGMTPESMKAAMSTPSGITLNALVSLDSTVRAGIASATRGAIDYARSMND